MLVLVNFKNWPIRIYSLSCRKRRMGCVADYRKSYIGLKDYYGGYDFRYIFE